MLLTDKGVASTSRKFLVPQEGFPVVEIPEEESCFLSNCRFKERACEKIDL